MSILSGPWRTTEIGVDYFAGTTDDPIIGREVIEYARTIIDTDNLGVSANSGHAEQGYFGVRSPHAFVGERDDGVYVRFGSARAGDHWYRATMLGVRCSRLDVQVTACGPGDDSGMAERIFHGGRLPQRVRGARPKMEIYSTESGGSTLYCGSQRSSVRGRIYDKARESKNDYCLGSWRWEVQFRHEYARSLCDALSVGGSVEPRIASTVGIWFIERGLPIQFDTPLPHWEGVYTRRTTDDEKRLLYLRKSIKPMIARLLGHYSKRELRQALGLQYSELEQRGEMKRRAS
jgi:hypothetical protein